MPKPSSLLITGTANESGDTRSYLSTRLHTIMALFMTLTHPHSHVWFPFQGKTTTNNKIRVAISIACVFRVFCVCFLNLLTPTAKSPEAEKYGTKKKRKKVIHKTNVNWMMMKTNRQSDEIRKDGTGVEMCGDLIVGSGVWGYKSKQ